MKYQTYGITSMISMIYLFIGEISDAYLTSLEKLSSYNNAFIGCIDYKGIPLIFFSMSKNYTFNKSFELKLILKNREVDKVDMKIRPLFEKYLSYVNEKYKMQIENIFIYSNIENTWENDFCSSIKMEECYIIKDYYNDNGKYVDAKLYMMN